VRTDSEYKHNAEGCRKLARQMTVLEDKKAFEEMAQTLDMLAKLCEHDVGPED
jgi:hypothetical protein